jgi:hypothetical protein
MNRQTLALLPASCMAAVFFMAAEANSLQPPAPSAVDPAPYGQDATPDPGAPARPAGQTAEQSVAANGQLHAKKVWTNDNMSDLPSHLTTTTSRDASKAKAKTTNPAGTPAAAANDRNENWYRDQIAKLEAQILLLDEKIARLQSALAGHPVPQNRPYGWVKPGNWRDQKTQLEGKRDAIRSRISALEDEARHRAVPMNARP